MSGSNPYEWLQDLVGQVPELVQPFIVALAGAIPYIEGEGSAALGVFAGIHPLVAAVSGAAGNVLAVVLVVLLSSRARDAALARRERRAEAAVAPTAVAIAAPSGATVGSAPGTAEDPTGKAPDEKAPDEKENEPSGRQAKGRKRLRRWLVRFGVPGASLLGPLALPTHLTAATLVASGVSKSWVILWQVIAIVLWTALVTAAATGLINAISAV